MGYALVIGNCYACGNRFTFNPVKVPSFRDGHGVRQPVCAGCIAKVNKERLAMGLNPFQIPPDAYKACDEGELEA